MTPEERERLALVISTLRELDLEYWAAALENATRRDGDEPLAASLGYFAPPTSIAVQVGDPAAAMQTTDAAHGSAPIARTNPSDPALAYPQSFSLDLAQFIPDTWRREPGGDDHWPDDGGTASSATAAYWAPEVERILTLSQIILALKEEDRDKLARQALEAVRRGWEYRLFPYRGLERPERRAADIAHTSPPENIRQHEAEQRERANRDREIGVAAHERARDHDRGSRW